MAGILGTLVILLIVLVLLVWLLIERQYQGRPGNRLELESGKWTITTREPQHYVIEGEPALVNLTRTLEIMVPEISVEAKLLSGASLEDIKVTTHLVSNHKDAPARADNYWFAYIVKTAKSTGLKVTVDIQGPDLSDLKALWVKVHYLSYGPEGRIPKQGNVVVPLKFPDPNAPKNWRSTPRAEVLPIPTHLLGPLDSPIDTVKRYVEPYAKPGDIVTIGETPVAIMQGRWRHPSDIKPGWVAKRICYFFMPTSSLATACGMQTLVDLVGPVRVVYAFVVGAIAKKFFGRPGMFYELAGDQARLIDDVTGTLPPYDQFIVLGPQNPEQIVRDIYDATGLKAAIVDVNDLKAVKILAATPGADLDLITSALLDNPAGNADEQTPVVLIHPKS
ncbi:F420-0:Gamma-glutamyl ligase [Leptothoe sp. PORK10 BA2]|uniref:F420-0:Gamma-glutamyl ligase n=1 Tax=Leptothoe sp. PORK10 BA2 TaxID=3110254 RepID=UPI002B207537|nr:F420-0:Gamma-glutamyl ligase [Leptothoe sp. PORK10 BA2]MEA5463479.1 F420-0:Gamma-glutamyl ligase [Leptothoe sp. PORK10 BA2]